MTKFYKIPGHYGTYYTVKSLSEIWQNINKDDLDALEITGNGDFKISFQRQFETFYRDMPLRHQDLEWAEVTFFTILEENRILINKIKRIKEEIEKLEKPENWRNVTLMFNYNKGDTEVTAKNTQGGYSNTEGSSQDGGSDTTSTSNITYGASQTGLTDSNSKVEIIEDLESLDAGDSEGKTLRERIRIPDKPLELLLAPNQLNQSKSLNIVDKELELVKGTKNENSTITTSASSSVSENKSERQNVMIGKNVHTNTSLESMQYLSTEIPKIRNRFLTAFVTLFNI